MEPGQAAVAFALVSVVVVVLILLVTILQRYRKVGPNEALIVSGMKYKVQTPKGIQERGFRIKSGGGTIVWPFFEKAETLSLELMTLDVKTPEVYTILGVPVLVDGVAQIKVRGDDVSIATAAEQFLGKGVREVMTIALQTVEGHLRAIMGTMTVEDIYKNREQFSSKVQDVAASDMANMGLQIVSFTLRDIKDSHGYLDALGKPRTAEVKRDAIIAQAEADRDATIKSAEAKQAGEKAKFMAQTKIAEAERDFQIKSAEYQYQTNEKKAEADLAYDLQKYKTGQLVKREEVQVALIQKEQEILVQEKEIQRRERELDASVKKPADAQRYSVQIQADAQKYKYEMEAKGQAEAIKAKGFADADVVRANGIAAADATKAQGMAEADVVQAKGVAEATAMEKKAGSWRLYNEAAITQMFVDVLPELARAVAEPLTKTERIVVINSGGDSAGASKITNDVANIIGQLPPIVESLTGVDLEKMVSKVAPITTQQEDPVSQKAQPKKPPPPPPPPPEKK